VAKTLTDDQQSAIDRAASALHPTDRPTFHARVHEQLATVPEVGDGLVYRVAASVQRSLFKPPADALEHHEPRHLKRFG
jgi:hypothetical protein